MPKRKVIEKGDSESPIKPKQKRTAPTNTSLLPPCKVCLEPAAGFHYGVNTCEACKGFFRRTLMREGDYVCVTGQENCNVIQSQHKSNKRICSRCRHLKCIAVGMSVDAIKTGRYTHSKRTQDILEYKLMLGKDTTSSTNSALSPSDALTNSTTATSASSEPVSLKSADAGTPHQSITTSPGPLSGSSDAGTPQSITTSPRTVSVNCVPLPSPSEECDSPSQFITLTPIQFLDLKNSPLSSLSQGSCSQHENDHEHILSSPPLASSSTCAPACIDNMLHHMVSVESGRTDDSASVFSKDSSICSPLPSFSGDCATSQPTESSSTDMTDEECERLTHQILQSHSISSFGRCTFTAEELLESQRKCHERRLASLETFGHMGSISQEEYMDVYKSTGIDVDNRQFFLSKMSELLERKIIQYIKFVKEVPGFCELTLDDRVRLIKDNRCEIMALCQVKWYNADLMVYTLQSGRSYSVHNASFLVRREHQMLRHKCLKYLQSLDLTEEEITLFKCVVLFTVGRSDVDEPEHVSALQWRMTQCLRWLLKQTRENPDRLFARIITILCSMRDISCEMHEWMKSEPFAPYAQVNQNELLAEWFSAS